MERATPILPIDDPAQAKRFYVDGLGDTCVGHPPENTAKRDPFDDEVLGVRKQSLRLPRPERSSGHPWLKLCFSTPSWRHDRAILENESNLTDPSGNTLFVVGPAPT
jgi:hypothetical protein